MRKNCKKKWKESGRLYPFMFTTCTTTTRFDDKFSMLWRSNRFHPSRPLSWPCREFRFLDDVDRYLIFVIFFPFFPPCFTTLIPTWRMSSGWTWLAPRLIALLPYFCLSWAPLKTPFPVYTSPLSTIETFFFEIWHPLPRKCSLQKYREEKGH